MSDSTVTALNHAVQDAQAWLKALGRDPAFEDEQQAYTGLRAVLHTLRDRLTVDEAVQLAAEMPTLVRGIYYEGWRPALAPNDEKTPTDFYASIDESLRNARATLDTEAATRAVLAFLDTRISAGELADVRGQLPGEIQSLWPRTH